MNTTCGNVNKASDLRYLESGNILIQQMTKGKVNSFYVGHKNNSGCETAGIRQWC